MRDQPESHTLQPTALVHEVFLKLFSGVEREWEDRQHFLSVAAKAMRQILVDHARSKGRKKRGGDAERDPLEGLAAPIADFGADLGDLDDALTALETEDARAASVVELRFFAGLSVVEVASQLGISTRQVERDWTYAKVWLRRRLG
jgi:RNA polymerase sigma factor (TIGR02999 family)